MPHMDWCGKPCGDCKNPCALDESMPCGPGCEYLLPSGERNIEECVKIKCDAYEPEESSKHVAWKKYLKYLLDWAESHSKPEFYGMTPACFDEWFDCEFSEDI